MVTPSNAAGACEGNSRNANYPRFAAFLPRSNRRKRLARRRVRAPVLLFTPGPNHLSHQDRAPFAALPRPRFAHIGLVRRPLPFLFAAGRRNMLQSLREFIER